MTVWGDRLSALLASAGAVYLAYISWNYPADGDIFPKFISGAVIFTSVLLIIRTFSGQAIHTGHRIVLSLRDDGLPLLLVAIFVGYVQLIFWLGYFSATALFLPGLGLMVGMRSIKGLAIVTIVTLPLLYAFFEGFLSAQLPRGIFF